jgi:hypothetical protein
VCIINQFPDTSELIFSFCKVIIPTMTTKELSIEILEKSVAYDIRNLDAWKELDAVTPVTAEVKPVTQAGVQHATKSLLEDVDRLHELKYNFSQEE